MTIKREDLDNHRIDLTGLTDGKRLDPVHPGEILHDLFLAPMGMSVYALANKIKVPRSRLNEIVRCRRAITTETALRLSRFFGTSAEFWVNLQSRHDLDVAGRALRVKIDKEIKPHAA